MKPSFPHIDSYYAASSNPIPDYPSLRGTSGCDVCVVGAGYTGLSAAFHLAEMGYDVILLEANKVAWGASGRNGGQLGSGQRVDQDELQRMLGTELSMQLWKLAEESKKTVKALINRFNIQCDLKPGVVHAAHKSSLAKVEMAYAEKLNESYNYPHIRPVAQSEMREMLETSAYFGGSIDTDAGHLHPLNYALGLAKAAQKKGVRIFEKSPLQNIRFKSHHQLLTEFGEVKARFVMLACNGYLGHIEPRIEKHIMPINNFILATEPLDESIAQRIIRDDVAVADSKFVVNYFRLSADRRLLFGGGENYTRRFPADIKSFVRKYMLKIYPQLAHARIDYGWGGTLAITRNRMPHIGRLESDMYYAQGFSGHGVGMATLAGKLAAQAIAGTAERFDLFADRPPPAFPGGKLLRFPTLLAGMLFYSLRDRM